MHLSVQSCWVETGILAPFFHFVRFFFLCSFLLRGQSHNSHLPLIVFEFVYSPADDFRVVSRLDVELWEDALPLILCPLFSRRCIQIVHKLLCYQKKCRVRLHYTWRELWSGTWPLQRQSNRKNPEWCFFGGCRCLFHCCGVKKQAAFLLKHLYVAS